MKEEISQKSEEMCFPIVGALQIFVIDVMFQKALKNGI